MHINTQSERVKVTRAIRSGLRTRTATATARSQDKITNHAFTIIFTLLCDVMFHAFAHLSENIAPRVYFMRQPFAAIRDVILVGTFVALNQYSKRLVDLSTSRTDITDCTTL